MVKRREKRYRGEPPKTQKSLNRKVFGSIMLCVCVLIFAKAISGGLLQKKDKAQSGENKTEYTDQETAEEQWKLILINKDNYLPKEFKVSLQGIDGGKVDTRIVEAILRMIQDAKLDGVTLKVTSAYRDVAHQTTLYEGEINKYKKQGFNDEESRQKAGWYVNPPGASEHHTGLAVDFITNTYSSLDNGFAETEAYAWLQENAAKYGFIERYPQGKEETTGVNWEPWHYRYIGVKNAKDISAAGLCLEEFIEQKDN